VLDELTGRAAAEEEAERQEAEAAQEAEEAEESERRAVLDRLVGGNAQDNHEGQ
jgi:hypothetical protein